MRSLCILAVMLAVPARATAQSEGEKAHRACMDKLRAAKTLRLVFRGTARHGAKSSDFQGVLLLGPANQFRFECKDNDETTLIISDGAKLTCNGARDPALPVHAGARAIVLSYLERYGLYAASSLLADELKPRAAEKRWPIVAITLAGMEKVGGKDAVRLEYSAVIPGLDDVVYSLWIDKKTMLPLKRSLSVDGDEMFVEEYTELALDVIHPKAAFGPKAE